ncbi:calponin homology domain-containing protein DDB_G0272472-like [Brachionichthys hirsutus]|uniref:calponin homology domain-containing protein DDB_G0272472-like n=1 Tax=Brachionichthys hirsutus TaxID=412623 RepID=UPI003604D59C
MEPQLETETQRTDSACDLSRQLREIAAEKKELELQLKRERFNIQELRMDHQRLKLKNTKQEQRVESLKAAKELEFERFTRSIAKLRAALKSSDDERCSLEQEKVKLTRAVKERQLRTTTQDHRMKDVDKRAEFEQSNKLIAHLRAALKSGNADYNRLNQEKMSLIEAEKKARIQHEEEKVKLAQQLTSTNAECKRLQDQRLFLLEEAEKDSDNNEQEKVKLAQELSSAKAELKEELRLQVEKEAELNAALNSANAERDRLQDERRVLLEEAVKARDINEQEKAKLELKVTVAMADLKELQLRLEQQKKEELTATATSSEAEDTLGKDEGGQVESQTPKKAPKKWYQRRLRFKKKNSAAKEPGQTRK